MSWAEWPRTGCCFRVGGQHAPQRLGGAAGSRVEGGRWGLCCGSTWGAALGGTAPPGCDFYLFIHSLISASSRPQRAGPRSSSDNQHRREPGAPHRAVKMAAETPHAPGPLPRAGHCRPSPARQGARGPRPRGAEGTARAVSCRVPSWRRGRKKRQQVPKGRGEQPRHPARGRAAAFGGPGRGLRGLAAALRADGAGSGRRSCPDSVSGRRPGQGAAHARLGAPFSLFPQVWALLWGGAHGYEQFPFPG